MLAVTGCMSLDLWSTSDVTTSDTQIIVIGSMETEICPNCEGCPIHPTRVDSSLVFAIWQTGNRVVNPIPSNRHKSFPLLLIRHAVSWFVRDLKRYSWSALRGWVKMLSIRVDLIESTRIVQIDWSLWLHFKNEEGSCIVISWILTSAGLYRVV